MYNLSILSCYQKQGEIEVTRQSCSCWCVPRESDPQEVSSSLVTEISIAKAV